MPPGWCYNHIIFDTNTATAAQFFNQQAVKMSAQWAGEQWIQKRRNKIDSGLDCYHHAGFKCSGQAQKRCIFRWWYGLSGHIVNLHTQKVANTMGEKHPGNAFINQSLITQPGGQSRRIQQRGNACVSLAMNSDVINARSDHVAQTAL